MTTFVFIEKLKKELYDRLETLKASTDEAVKIQLVLDALEGKKPRRRRKRADS